MLLGDIIKQYRENHNMSLQDFANLIGTSRSYIHMLEKNVNPSTNKPISPSIDTLRSLANAMNMDFELLLKQLDENQNIYIDEKEYEKQFTDELGNPVSPIPLIGVVKAGYDYLAEENWKGTINVEKILVGDGSEYFALEVTGDSMAPTFVEGDIVVVHKQNNCENNEIAIVIVNGDEGTIKKVKKSDAGIILQPLNTAYAPMLYSNEEIRSIPVIIAGVVKQLKREF